MPDPGPAVDGAKPMGVGRRVTPAASGGRCRSCAGAAVYRRPTRLDVKPPPAWLKTCPLILPDASVPNVNACG